jgi:hypothetical protein
VESLHIKLLYAVNEVNPDLDWYFVSGFCTCVCEEREAFPYFIVWSDEATLNLNGTSS